jgi:hypothetical protein
MRKSMDRRPGPQPDITSDREGITFVMQVGELFEDSRLTIRCDANGNIWAAIRRTNGYRAAPPG